jgi:hypothetical protein
MTSAAFERELYLHERVLAAAGAGTMSVSLMMDLHLSYKGALPEMSSERICHFSIYSSHCAHATAFVTNRLLDTCCVYTVIDLFGELARIFCTHS